ncbi:hypothetical protein [Ancylobacter amanitiformis]|uniref:Uncharacterized protein n=1 Tax=Ancylobacter amanitiformis TaxID=217069 RepID=A0ABU0LSK2_9HYPH|nr:hypothetical protein [Ancylobacter amanitiformis]MDQ0511666.1 hypothetical protein [Ancylobacter amanitiformis]
MEQEDPFFKALAEVDAGHADIQQQQAEDPTSQPAPDSAQVAQPASSPTPASAPAQPTEDPSLLERSLSGAADLWKSIGGGVAKAGIETKDFLLGEPAPEDKSALRTGIEQRTAELGAKSPLNAVGTSVAQIVTGLIGADKVLGPVKLLQKSKAGFEMAKGAFAGYVALDPHEARLSDALEQFPALTNPVTRFLASDPEDSAALGRFKNALESLGVDLAFVGAVQAVKFLRTGKTDEAATVIEKLREEPSVPVPPRRSGPWGPYPEPEPLVTTKINDQPTAPSVNDNTPLMGVKEPANDTIAGPKGSVHQADLGVRTEDEPGALPPKADNQNAQIDASKLPSNGPVNDNVKPGAKASAEESAAIPPEPAPDAVYSKAGEGGGAGAKSRPWSDMPDDKLKEIMARTEADQEAVIKYGSRDAAEDAGHEFDANLHIPWQRIWTTDDSQALMNRTAEVLKEQYDTAKGGAVLTDAKATKLGEEFARAYNMDPDFVLGSIREAGAAAVQSVPHMEAAMRISSKMFADADHLFKQIQLGNLDEFGGDASMAMAEMTRRVAAAADVAAHGLSIASNMGRGLRRLRSDFKDSAANIAALKDFSPESLAAIMAKADGDPSKLIKLASPTWGKRVLAEMQFHTVNGLLWLWPTHTINATSNALMTLARPTEKLFGSAALRLVTRDPGKRAELSALAKQAKREYAYTVSSLYDGFSHAVEAFLRGDSILSPHGIEAMTSESAGTRIQPIVWKPTTSVWGVVQNAWQAATYRNLVGMPTRATGATDELFQQLRYRSVVQSRAAVEAGDAGLTGQAFKDYVQAALNKAIDADTGQALDSAALRESRITTFQQDLDHPTLWDMGSLGKGLSDYRATVKPLGILMPFIKTPTNALRYGIKLTPGINMLQHEFKLDIMGANGVQAQAQAMGQMALGSLFAGVAAHLALSGQVTGGGPSNPEAKKAMLETGWRPYSMPVTDEDGNTAYVQYGRLDPYGTAIGLVADIVELMVANPDKDYSQAAQAVVVSLAKNLWEKSALINAKRAFDAFSDPENKLPNTMGQTAGAMLPFSSLLRGVNPDPYLREARGFVDGMIKGVPGLSDTLPMKLDVWGDPMLVNIGLSGHQDHDVVDAEMNRIALQTGQSLGKPAPNFEGVDLRDITLKDGRNAYERFQELSGHLPGQKPLKQVVAKLIKSTAFQDLPDGDPGVKGTRLNAIARLVSEYRTSARKVLISKYREDLGPLVMARQREAAGAIIKNRRERNNGEPGARTLLQALTPR